MGNNYSWGYNQFQDFLLQLLIYNNDISDVKLKSDIHIAFSLMLENVLVNQKDIVYLDFDIIKNDIYFKIVGNNAVSAIWLSGIFPKNTEFMLKNNIFKIGDITYHYDIKTRELAYGIVKEKKKTEK